MVCEICKNHDNGAKANLDSDYNDDAAVCNLSYHAFYHELVNLVNKYADMGTSLKMRHDDRCAIIRIMGDGATPHARALDGLEDVLELAQSTAEHHPYWNLLYNASEIARAALEVWQSSLSDKQIEEIQWSIREINSTLERFSNPDK